MPRSPRSVLRNVPSVEHYVSQFPSNIRSVVSVLRALIRHSVPDHLERVYVGWKLIGYRVVKGKESRYFCFIAPSDERVVLGFEYGKMLSDPDHVLEGNGSRVRQVVLKKSSDVRKSVLVPLILEAAMIAERTKR